MRNRLVTAVVTLLFTGIVFAQETATDETVMDLEQLQEAFSWNFDTPIEVQTVAEGLHVFFGVGGNIAVSIGESGVLVVDDQFPEMIPKVNEAIAELGGGLIDFAINTHWHFDHADGNKALGPAGSWIVAHEHSAEMMAKDNIINLVIAKYKQDAYPPAARPVISFADRMTFHFNGGDIDVIHAGAAHTAGDVAVIFRKQNAVHFGDVFNKLGYPFIDVDSGGSIDGMIRFCETVYAELNPDTIVIPGHGVVTDMPDLAAYIDMLKTVRQRVKALIDDGKSLVEVEAAHVTADLSERYGDVLQSLGFVNRVYTSLTK
ncbi:MAG: MBL fold metallo-hydrolase [Pseudomonadales bacterium]|nr:MBL fold metallo-hydrolase [Pseudomonadales bacterium]